MCRLLPRVYNGLHFQHGIFHYFTYLLPHRRVFLRPQGRINDVVLRSIPNIFGYVWCDWKGVFVVLVLVHDTVLDTVLDTFLVLIFVLDTVLDSRKIVGQFSTRAKEF